MAEAPPLRSPTSTLLFAKILTTRAAHGGSKRPLPGNRSERFSRLGLLHLVGLQSQRAGGGFVVRQYARHIAFDINDVARFDLRRFVCVQDDGVAVLRPWDADQILAAQTRRAARVSELDVSNSDRCRQRDFQFVETVAGLRKLRFR